jgi:PilZ domain
MREVFERVSEPGAASVRNSPASERRRSKRSTTKNRASLIVNLKGRAERFPCIVVDRSEHGLRLRGGFQLKRGQVVEVGLDEDFLTVQCRVKWVGKGEAGLETV